jgi:hypothetical protein
MEELYYLQNLDLLIKVMMDEDEGYVRFYTHRHITESETSEVEHFIHYQIGFEVPNHSGAPEFLRYAGLDSTLASELRFHRLQGTIKNVLNKKQDIDIKVHTLIETSLSTYYFERLGDELVKLRKALNAQESKETLHILLQNIKILLDAYNSNSGQNLELSQVVPEHLIE